MHEAVSRCSALARINLDEKKQVTLGVDNQVIDEIFEIFAIIIVVTVANVHGLRYSFTE